MKKHILNFLIDQLFIFLILIKSIIVVMMCANPGTIREIMLAADDLNMIDSGEYVFFNIELYTG